MSRRSPSISPRAHGWLLGLVVALALGLGGLGTVSHAPAAAQPAQPTATPTATATVAVVVTPSTGPAGTVFHFKGQGFVAKETVRTVVKWPDGTEEADVLYPANADGAVEFIWDSHGAVPGRYTMTGTGIDSGRGASTPFTVQ